MIDYKIKRRLQRIASTYNAKARKYHAPGVVNWEMLASLGTTCRYCGVEIDLGHGTWDHILPFYEGGWNYITNIARCCTTCQRRKFTKSPTEFAEHRQLSVTCARPGCGNTFQPRWAEYKRGMARFCSHQCAGAARGQGW